MFRRRTLFLSIGPILLLWLARPTRGSFWVGVAFAAAGELIRVWSAGYLTKLSTVVTAGPFALCRNPLYIGSFLISVGYLCMCRRLDVWIIGTALFWLFHGGAIVHEEKLLLEKFGEDYASYCKRVPRFVPRPASLAGNGQFSWSQVLLNNEYRSAGAAAAMCVLFGLMAYGDTTASGWFASLRR